MAVALESVVKQLADSGIVAPGHLENFVPPKAHPQDGETLLRQLIKQNHLTKFQAQQIAQGRGKSLMLGNYTILDKIGAGGMGQVFKAEHRRLERTVAIKMLPASMTKDAAAVARFQREVKAAAKLRHPNIVATDDADEAHGVHFLVMEYIEGSDLSALVKKNGPFPVAQAVNYVLQAAVGLEFAHKKGVIHRDIKPANLLLDKEGTVKILDMGLARIEADGNAATQAELTGTGAVMGTVDYMSPEQALNTRTADARADIYSLGCSLYYLIAGKATYAGESIMEKLLAHREQAIPSLKEASPDVSNDLEAVFQKMVAKHVPDRYQTMGEVIAALEPLCAGQATSQSIQQEASTKHEDSALTFFQNLPSESTAAKTKPTKQLATKPTPAAQGKTARPPWKNRKVLAGAGALLLVLGIWVIVRDKSGNEVARVPVPEGGSAIVQTNSDPKPTPPTTSAKAFTPTTNPTPVGPQPPPAKAPFDAKQARAHQEAWAKHLGTTVETTNSVGARMILIPPGEFLMGSTDEQVEAALRAADEVKADEAVKGRIEKAERPQHLVAITKPLLMSATEVTIGQFKQFSAATDYQTEAEKEELKAKTDPLPTTTPGKPPLKPKVIQTYLNPGYAVDDNSPAAVITWNDAVAYCNWLSGQEQREPCYRQDGNTWLALPDKNGYRLPTEAEWEYACRAGTTTQYSFGDDHQQLDQYGWYNKNSGNRSHAVGTKLPNPFGLSDMHGNVLEWCGDFYDEKWYAASPSNDPVGPTSGSDRVIHGGNWFYNASLCRSAYRYAYTPSIRNYYFGFRCVLVW